MYMCYIMLSTCQLNSVKTVPVVVLVRSKRQRRDLAEPCLDRKTGTTQERRETPRPDMSSRRHVPTLPRGRHVKIQGLEWTWTLSMQVAETFFRGTACNDFEDKWNHTFLNLPWTERTGTKRIQHDPTGMHHCGVAPHVSGILSWIKNSWMGRQVSNEFVQVLTLSSTSRAWLRIVDPKLYKRSRLPTWRRSTPWNRPSRHMAGRRAVA